MSKDGRQSYRPALHFTPVSGWMNDPNGLIYWKGSYHLFYQYHPDDTVWGPMHWGHGISRDLIHWEHLLPALVPDEKGTMFSGCAVWDRADTADFDAAGAMVLIFTQMLPGCQSQSLAWSRDGRSFSIYQGNPVLEHRSSPDFRDPKVIWHDGLKCWVMAVAAGRTIEFYHSRNLKDWKKTAAFEDPSLGDCIWECPDLFELETAAGKRRWILLASLIRYRDEAGRAADKYHEMRYYTGSFDGSSFVPEGSSSLLDYGCDYYAAVSFAETEERILMGWAANWRYAAAAPTGEYRGAMAIPRVLTLKGRDGSYCLANAFWPETVKMFGAERPVTGSDRLRKETFRLRVCGEGDFIIRLVSAKGECLELGLSGQEFFVNRSHSGEMDFDGLNLVTSRRLLDGEFTADIIWDVSVLEVLAENGRMPVTMTAYPQMPYDRLEVAGKAAVWLSELR